MYHPAELPLSILQSEWLTLARPAGLAALLCCLPTCGRFCKLLLAQHFEVQRTWRTEGACLLPKRSQIQAKIDAEGRAALEVKSKAQAMATALSTIGKFIVKKKVPPPPPSPPPKLSGACPWSCATAPWRLVC